MRKEKEKDRKKKKTDQHGCRSIGSKRLPNVGRTDAFHVYAVEWEPREIRWLCDGVVMGTLTNWCTYGPSQVADGAFDDPDLVLWLRAGAKIAEPEVADGALKVHLLGDVHEQHLQMMSHVKRPKIRKGQWYRLSFRVKSSVACRHVRPVVERPNAGWQKLFCTSRWR